jgi:hypothetical protein
MNELTIQNVGTLEFRNDHWECWDIPTNIGSVDLQVDSLSIEHTTLPRKIQAIFSQIELIDEKARKYLNQNVPRDELIAFGNLIEPSILLSDEDDEGHFTLFYSCSNNDEMVCGVDFNEFEPFDLTIGD